MVDGRWKLSVFANSVYSFADFAWNGLMQVHAKVAKGMQAKCAKVVL